MYNTIQITFTNTYHAYICVFLPIQPVVVATQNQIMKKAPTAPIVKPLYVSSPKDLQHQKPRELLSAKTWTFSVIGHAQNNKKLTF